MTTALIRVRLEVPMGPGPIGVAWEGAETLPDDVRSAASAILAPFAAEVGGQRFLFALTEEAALERLSNDLHRLSVDHRFEIAVLYRYPRVGGGPLFPWLAEAAGLA